MRAGIPCSLLLALGGCFHDGGGDAGGSFPGPLSGAWRLTEGEPSDDTCMWDDRPAIAAGDVEVSNDDEGTFTVSASTGAEPTVCVWMDEDFECDPMAGDPIAVLDAEIETISVSAGTFSSPEQATGSYRMAVDCSGAACEAAVAAAGLAAIPCSYTVAFTAAFVK